MCCLNPKCCVAFKYVRFEMFKYGWENIWGSSGSQEFRSSSLQILRFPGPFNGFNVESLRDTRECSPLLSENRKKTGLSISGDRNRVARSHADDRRFPERGVFSGVRTFLGYDPVTKIVDGSERNPDDLYRAEKERRHAQRRNRCADDALRR